MNNFDGTYSLYEHYCVVGVVDKYNAKLQHLIDRRLYRGNLIWR